MKNTIIFILVLFFSSSIIVQGQQMKANISFQTTHHNYGKIKEEQGISKFMFVFTNTGNEPLIVQSVKPSCGCTSSDWTRQPIPPGGEGYVTAEYNPKNRPGPFSKSIRVTTNAEPALTILRISGEVLPRDKTLEDLYPAAAGPFRMKTSHQAFMKTFNTQIRTEKVGVVNNSDEKITVEFNNVPSFITLKLESNTLNPKEETFLEVTYDAIKKNDWGFILDRINIVVTSESGQISKGRLSVSAVIEEDFSHLSEKELAKAAEISFENLTFDFGTLKQGESVEHEYVFTNTGKSDLVIRKTKASCGCTAIMPSKNIVPPGEKSTIKMRFNSTGKKGPQNKTITVTSNDPKNSSLKLRIKGNILVN